MMEPQITIQDKNAICFEKINPCFPFDLEWLNKI